jgi:ABC-2 type transport system permease protein
MRGPTMRQFASEFRKLVTSRSVYSMLAALLAIVAVGVVATITDGGSGRLLVPIERQAFLHVSMTIVPLFALLLGLRAFTDEFRYGSIVPTLLASPNRLRVLGAKLATVAVGGVALTLAATATSVAIGVPLLLVKGVDVTWSVGGIAELVSRLLVATVIWSAAGVGLGLAVRHQVAAIAGALIWLLAGEGILSGLVPDVARFFPGSAGLAIVGINPSLVLSPAFGALVLGSYAVAAVSAGAVLMQRRDIT